MDRIFFLSERENGGKEQNKTIIKKLSQDCRAPVTRLKKPPQPRHKERQPPQGVSGQRGWGTTVQASRRGDWTAEGLEPEQCPLTEPERSIQSARKQHLQHSEGEVSKLPF